MKTSAVLVALLALSIQANEIPKKESRASGSGPPSPPSSAPPPPSPRQGRGFDFLAPFRGIFGRPRGVAPGSYASPSKQHGLKPAASETSNKPNQAAYSNGEPHDSFRPAFASGFEGFGDYGPPSHMPKHHGGKNYPPPKHGARPQRQPHSYPNGPAPGHLHHGPSSQNPQYPSSHGHSHGHGPAHGPAHGHSHGPSHGPAHGPSHGPAHGPAHGPSHGHGASSPYNPQSQPQQTYHTFADPQVQHHHYHAFQNGQEGPANNEIGGSPGYNYQNQGPQAYDAPQTAQQFNRPSLTRPGPSGPTPSDAPFGFDQPAPGGFGDFAGFGGSGSPQVGFGGAGSQAGFHTPQAAGSGNTVRGPASSGTGAGGSPGPFFGGPEEYPEQYEEQNRNVRQPEIITADNYYQGQGSQYEQGQYPQAFNTDNGYYPGSGSGAGGQGPAPANSELSSNSYGFPEGPSYASSGPVHKSHPLRSHAGGRHRPSSTTPAYGSHGGQEESRKQHYLYRPVSSSIRVPGAVDEDAVYGRPMMMSASQKRQKLRASSFKPSPTLESDEREASASTRSTTERIPPPPYKKSSKDIIQLESPSDPTHASLQSSSVMDSEAAASGHGGHFDHHGLESSNGDRILYHVAGHQGPYSYRFGYDTGKGYNRQFRHEEKDGKGHVTGKYGFYDKHGKLNVVKYQAHPKHGYHAEREQGHHHQSHHISH